MKIGLLVAPWLPVPPKAYGGIEHAVDVLARGLAELGHEVHLHATSDSTCPVRRSATFGSAPRWRMGHSSLEMRRVIDGYERLGDCNIIHDHTLLGPFYGSTWTPAAGRIVTTVHGSFDDELTALYRSLGRQVPVVAISHRQAALSPVPVAAVIHHGVRVETIPVGSGSGGYLAFLGRMSPEKGVHRAIVAARSSGWPLRIAAKLSEPDEHRYFETVIEPQLGGGIEYVGELGSDEKYELLGGAAGLVNPITWEEPFGMVMIEALACGTPVIAFPVGAAPEIVDDGVTGFLCDRGDGLVRAIGRLHSIDRSACRADVTTRFSMQRVARDHARLYAEIMGKRTLLVNQNTLALT